MGNNVKCALKTFSVLFLSGMAIYSSMWVYGPVRSPEAIDTIPDVRPYQRKVVSDWKQIAPQIAYDRFGPLSDPSCETLCDKNRNPACGARTLKEWDKLFVDGEIEGVPLLRANEYMFPFEKEYLSLPALDDLYRLPDLSKSVIYHVDNKGFARLRSEVTCRYLDHLRFRVDFKDSYGDSRMQGGDAVRAWITGNPQNVSAHDFSAAGQVLDLQNGSYLVTVRCAWTGFASLKIGLAYPWEYLRAALYNFQHGVHVFVAGIFKRDSVEELLEISSERGFNTNLLPSHRLSCNDITGTISMPNVPRLLYTPAERVMGNAMTREASKMVVDQPINIYIKKEGGRELPQTSCSKARKALSWKFKYPRGFWSSGKIWTSLMCRQHEFSINWVHKCLKDTTIWIFGDSNAKQIYKALLRWVPCKGTGQMQLNQPFCFEKENRINITYVPHELTFYSNKTRALPPIVSLRQHVDLIPSTGRHFVLFHYFLHPSRAHPSALYFRLKNMKRLIINLLKRNPNVHIAVRGPHISTMQVIRNHILGGDVLGNFVISLYKQIFRDLSDYVLFLDGWDMTVAVENPAYHPIPQVAEELTRTFLAFKCD